MKRLLIFCGIITLTCLSCKKENADVECNNSRFYYYESEKIVLNEVYNKGTISFYDTLSPDAINMILKQYENIHYTPISIRTNWIIVTIDSKSCSETELFFSEIKKDDRVSNCNKYLISDKGDDLGIYDIFTCKVKNESLITEMNDLLLKTKTTIVEYNKYGNYYLIRVDKNSKGDALDISNEFYESGFFEWAEPDFIANFQPYK